MRFSILSLSLSILLAVSTLSHASLNKKQIFNPDPKSSLVQMQYLLYLPAQYDAQDQKNKKWPVVLFLHGAGERGKDATSLTNNHLPVVLEGRPNLPFIVVSPVCPSGKWWEAEYIETAHAILLETLKKYRTDPDRVILSGLSMGGYGTWNLAKAHPETFAAMAPICGGGGTDGMEKIKHLPAWVFHSIDDPIVPYSNSARSVKAMEAAGQKVIFTTLNGVGHDSWSSAYDYPRIWEWMLQQNRNPSNSPTISSSESAFFASWNNAISFLESNTMATMQLRTGSGSYLVTRKNTTSSTISETFSWSLQGNTNWKIEPASQSFKLLPGADASVTFNITFQGDQATALPFPQIQRTISADGFPQEKRRSPLPLDDIDFFRENALQHKAVKAGKIKIDGIFDEKSWNNANAITNFVSADGKQSYPHATKAKFLWDNKGLWVAFEMSEPQPSTMVAKQTKRDSHVYQDDCIQLYLDTDFDRKDYYHIVLNPKGTIMDSIIHDRKYNLAGMKVANTTGDQVWNVEIFIPWKEIDVKKPKSGMRIGLEINRDRRQGQPFGAYWSPTYSHWGHVPSRFGILVLE